MSRDLSPILGTCRRETHRRRGARGVLAEWEEAFQACEQDDRTAPALASHRACNRRAGAAKANRTAYEPLRRSRVW